MKPNKMTLVLSLICTLLMTSAIISSAGEPEVKGPVTDETWWVYPYTAGTKLQALKDGIVDSVPLYALWEVEWAIDNGFIVTEPGRGFTIYTFGFNLERAPMNDIYFRRAMAHLVRKEWMGSTLFGPCAEITDSMVPPGFESLGWYNPDVRTYDYDPLKAINMLMAGGYTPVGWDGTNPASITKWEDPGGTDLPTVKVTYVSEITDITDMTEDWINEMQAIGIPVTSEGIGYDLFNEKVWGQHDFDMHGCWTFYTYPTTLDWLYFWFHSSQNFPWGWNFWNFNNATVDAAVEIILASSDRPLVTEKILETQELIAEQVPAIPVVTLNWVWAFNPDMARTLGTGFIDTGMVPWSVVQWKAGPGGIHKTAQEVSVDTLHSLKTYSYTSIWINKLIAGRLVEFNPINGKLMPWLAKSWTEETWGDGAAKITLELEPEATWHDGEPITTADIKFTLETLLPTTDLMYIATGAWGNLKNVTIIDEHRCEIYYNMGGLWYMWHLSEWALRFPKHIWENPTDAAGNPVSAWDFEPWTIPHVTVDGVQLSKLIGAGPLMYPYGGWADGHLRCVSNRNFLKTPLTSEVNFDGIIDIFDIVTCAKAFGSEMGDPKWNSFADVTSWEVIDIFDVVKVASDFGETW